MVVARRRIGRCRRHCGRGRRCILYGNRPRCVPTVERMAMRFDSSPNRLNTLRPEIRIFERREPVPNRRRELTV